MWLLPVLASLLSFASASGQSFPYEVTVAAKETPVFSGPGRQYYQTGTVSNGETVEVYRRKAGGWLAIRPPEDSFSWVAAKQLRQTNDENIARAVGTSAVAWIGSLDGDVHDHKWQVKLEPGEAVAVLDKQVLTIFTGDRRREYCKIAPPAGEFRWLRERDVQANSQPIPADPPPAAVKLSQFQVVENQDDGNIDQPRDDFVTRGTATSGPQERVASLVPRPVFQPVLTAPKDFAAALEQLTVDLSLMAAKPPKEWEFTSLLRQAESVMEQSSTTLQRLESRRLLDEIRNFKNLQQGFSGISTTEPNAAGRTNNRDTQSSREANASTFDPRFDGRGWLLPVHSTKRAAPPYAILDDEGKILTFVSPAPGLNLHRYLRKEVGVFGQRSRATFFDKPHLTAERIVDLGRHRR